MKKLSFILLVVIFPFVYGYSQNLLALVEQNHKFGFIDTEGKVVIEIKYESGKSFVGGMARVRKGSEWIYVRPDGSELFVEGSSKLYDFYEGLAFVRVSDTKKLGYINKQGEWVIKPQFDVARKFIDGVAIVKSGDKWGYIKPDGSWFVEAKLDNAYGFEGEYAIVQYEKVPAFVDRNGNIVSVSGAQKIFKFYNGIALCRKNDKMGVIDGKGVWLKEPTFQKCGMYSEDLAAALFKDKWGFINTRGEWVAEPIYNRAKAFNNGFARVEKDGKPLFLRADGTELNIANAEALWDFVDDVAPAEKANRMGLVNTKGEWVVQPKFNIIRSLDGKVAKAYVRGKGWGYIDITGKWIMQPEPIAEDELMRFHDGRAAIRLQKKWQFIDEDGKNYSDGRYKYVFYATEKSLMKNFAPVMISVIGLMATKVMIVDYNDKLLCKGYKGGFAMVEDKQGWHFIDKSGENISDQYYEYIEFFRDVQKP